jgi:hypothetical protein
LSITANITNITKYVMFWAASKRNLSVVLTTYYMSRELLGEQQCMYFKCCFGQHMHENSKDCNDSKLGCNKELVCTM